MQFDQSTSSIPSKVSPGIEILEEGFTGGGNARKQQSQHTVSVAKRPRTCSMSQKEQSNIRSERSHYHSSAIHITKENAATTNNQEPSLRHNKEDIPVQPQVLVSEIPVSKALSSEAVGLTRPSHTDNLKTPLGSRRETVLIKRNLLLLKKNARLEHQPKICRQDLEELQSSKLNILANAVLVVDKGNDQSQKFICSECKAIFREAGCLSDLQAGEDPQEPLSKQIGGIPQEFYPQQGDPQEPPYQKEEKPQELSSSIERDPQEPSPSHEVGDPQEPPAHQPMVPPLSASQDLLIEELRDRLLRCQEEITLLKFQWTKYKTKRKELRQLPKKILRVDPSQCPIKPCTKGRV